MGPALMILRQAPTGEIRMVDEAGLRGQMGSLLDGGGGAGDRPVRVLDLRSDPAGKIAGVLAALSSPRPVRWFLGADHWTPPEVDQAMQLAQPDLVLWPDGTRSRRESDAPDESVPVRNLIMIPTGGTGGRIRFAMHSGETLAAAAHGVVQWCGAGAMDSTCFLPMHHVSGLMQAMRSWVSGGRLLLCDWKSIEAGVLPDRFGEGVRVVSLVPTQLARVLRLKSGASWLRGFACVFVGGAAAPDDLLDLARREAIALAPCYGMTETAAQVAALWPEVFLAGGTGVGRALPHAHISIDDKTGLLAVASPSLFLGYYPQYSSHTRWVSSDRATIDPSGNIRILGRNDRVINTGGEKVDATAVEQAILAIPGVRDAAVFGKPDPEWGEVVEAAVAGERSLKRQALLTALRRVVSAHSVPKRIIFVETIPRTSAGKIDYRTLTTLRTDRH